MSKEVKPSAALAAVGGVLMICVFVVAAVIYNTWAWAYVAGIVWNWFGHPMFPDLPVPTLDQFAALSLIVAIIRPKSVSGKTKGDWSWLVAPWGFLLGAWIVSHWFHPGPYAL